MYSSFVILCDPFFFIKVGVHLVIDANCVINDHCVNNACHIVTNVHRVVSVPYVTNICHVVTSVHCVPNVCYVVISVHHVVMFIVFLVFIMML